jgi:Swiss Army Knife RNA repair-like protein
MKVLFLDVDGVLITEASARYYRWLHRNQPECDKGWRVWCPIATNNLRTLMARIPDMKIVLSSCWRTGRTTEECADLLTEQGLAGSRLIGRTGHSEVGKVRGDEIQEWLDQNPYVSHFAIVDDDSDMAHLATHLVQTDFRVGLTLPHNDEIVRLLEA